MELRACPAAVTLGLHVRETLVSSLMNEPQNAAGTSGPVVSSLQDLLGSPDLYQLFLALGGAAAGHRGESSGLGVKRLGVGKRVIKSWPRASLAQQPREFSHLWYGNDESCLLGLGQVTYRTWKDLGKEV